ARPLRRLSGRRTGQGRPPTTLTRGPAVKRPREPIEDRGWWPTSPLVYEAVHYVHKPCNEAVGSIRRDTDFIHDETLFWTLRVVTGPAPSPRDGDPPTAVTASGVKIWVTPAIPRRRVADLDWIIVGYGSQLTTACWTDLGSAAGRSSPVV